MGSIECVDEGLTCIGDKNSQLKTRKGPIVGSLLEINSFAAEIEQDLEYAQKTFHVVISCIKRSTEKCVSGGRFVLCT